MPVWHEGPPYWGLCVLSFFAALLTRKFTEGWCERQSCGFQGIPRTGQRAGSRGVVLWVWTGWRTEVRYGDEAPFGLPDRKLGPDDFPQLVAEEVVLKILHLSVGVSDSSDGSHEPRGPRVR